MKMGIALFVHPTRDSEATETNHLNKIELLNTTGAGARNPPLGAVIVTAYANPAASSYSLRNSTPKVFP